MSHPLTPHWKPLKSLKQLDEILEHSRIKPVLVFKHRASSPESNHVKSELDNNWSIPENVMDLYLVDDMVDKEISLEVSELAGIPHEFPQVVLFADGVTMYDESHDMINVKKIKLALKIVNRTFKWMESRA